MKRGKLVGGVGELKSVEGMNASVTCVIWDTRDGEGMMGCCLMGV